MRAVQVEWETYHERQARRLAEEEAALRQFAAAADDGQPDWAALTEEVRALSGVDDIEWESYPQRQLRLLVDAEPKEKAAYPPPPPTKPVSEAVATEEHWRRRLRVQSAPAAVVAVVAPARIEWTPYHRRQVLADGGSRSSSGNSSSDNSSRLEWESYPQRQLRLLEDAEPKEKAAYPPPPPTKPVSEAVATEEHWRRRLRVQSAPAPVVEMRAVQVEWETYHERQARRFV